MDIHFRDILELVLGFIGGMTCTILYQKNVIKGSVIVKQEGISAGGDVVAGNKSSSK